MCHTSLARYSPGLSWIVTTRQPEGGNDPRSLVSGRRQARAETIHAERIARRALARGHRVALAYSDCGTYGALDELCSRLGLRRLPGLHCYDVLAGPSRVRELFDAEPGTYVLTDYLVRSFRRTVMAGLGLDKHPELWPEYFRHYRRVVWLAQDRSAALEAQAERVAARFGLPLTVIETGTGRLEAELARLVGDGTSSSAETAARPPAHSAPIPAGAPAGDGSL